MTRIKINNFVLGVLFLLPVFAIAQTITGTVKDKDGETLPYVKVLEDKATNKTVSAKDGSFSLRVSILPTKLIFKSIGYKEVIVAVTNEDAISVTLEKEDLSIQQLLSVGNPTKARTSIDTPVAITNISLADMQATGKVSLDEVLAYTVASYNATNQAFADVSTHFNTTDLKGLGASRMLVLVNGKRKNLSAIANINDTYGKGEVGVDLNSIPVAAIDHVEILREGASSIYGSDAMAGVINIVLRKNTDIIKVNYNAGITTKGDGMQVGGDVNGAFSNKSGAYVNYTVAVNYQDYTNRAGEPGKDDFYGVPSSDSWIKNNADLGMIVGQPRMITGNVYFNGAKPFKNGKGELYATVGGEVRQGKSFLFGIAPYMAMDPTNLYNGQGYTPELKTSIMDNMDVFGIKYNTNGFKFDLSGTFGINDVDIFVDESLNMDMAADTPKDFDNGGYRFQNTMLNFDLIKSFDALHLAFGAEYKIEQFREKQGELDSWYPFSSPQGGSVGYNGIEHQNKLKEDRNSFGAFLGLDYDISDDFLFGASARYDNYSDVGDQVSYKANARYKFGEKGAIRASYGTNFRAPALQQQFTNYTQNNTSVILNQVQRSSLGIANLEAETATNMNFGVFFNPMKDLTLSLDYYQIDVDNRVVLTSDFVDLTAMVHPYDAILTSENANTFKFFTNAVNTSTQGIDFAAKYDNIRFPSGVLAFTLTANWNKTEIVGDIKKPAMLTGYDLFNRTDRSYIETGRPDIKGSLGIKYALDTWDISLNNNYFGAVTWQHAVDPTKDQTYAAKFLTDIIVNYQYSKRLSFNLAAFNILNTYPDELNSNTDLGYGGRFVYPYQTGQIGTNGTTVKAGVTVMF